ncbi:MAG: urease accessory protein UreF [Verrucomicrobiae bacterium]|nr:urease accessory protein UreF [Verrucomicrobiae bacterium]
MIADPTLWLLQANDSAYPSGSYAHSFGLEELVEAGVVGSPEELERFLESQVLPALLTFDLPYFAKAHRAANEEDIAALLAMDSELDAWRLPEETREASRRIGSQRLDLLVSLDASDLAPRFRGHQPRGHHLIVTAIELAALPTAHAGRAFACQTVSGLTAASMKLIRIGQTSCQKILRRTLEKLGGEIDTALTRDPDGWFNPLLEIASLRHARSHARLFIS